MSAMSAALIAAALGSSAGLGIARLGAAKRHVARLARRRK